jgi:carbonic anhydrase/acetyltransferase-like protein (isoleucine patch superfamily)
MRKFIIEDRQYVAPFNEPASEMLILNKPVKLIHRDALDPFCDGEGAIENLEELPRGDEELLVYRDNVYFDEEYIKEFIRKAREHGRLTGQAGRASFWPTDKAFVSYCLPVARGIKAVPKPDYSGRPIRSARGAEEIDHYEIDLWYFPHGYKPDAQIDPVIVDSGWSEAGYYFVPDYMSKQGELTHYLTKRSMVSIESWMHVFFANVIMGIFSLGHRAEDRINRSNFFRLKVLWKSLIEQTQVLSCSELVQVGEGTEIDPSAIIQGPTIIGKDCNIGPGAVIGNCYIGDGVSIAQGCQLMLSVVGNNCFLPFRASLFMTAIMDNSIVAQNTCLQMCVVGRDSFIGAGTTFTDFNLLPTPLKIEAMDGLLERIGQVVLGGCVGHNCRLGSGLIIYPARMIESDVILFASPNRRVIKKNITYEESDHHELRSEIARLHKRRFPRVVKSEADLIESW